MIRLINERDPKRVDPKHMAGKEILVRDKDEIFIANVVVINNISYVYRWGSSKELNQFDGWATMPIETIDEEKHRREIDMFFSED
jgi:hypothetical protein